MTYQIETDNKDIQHFSGKVSEALALKLHELATAAKDDFIADLPGWPEPYGTKDISAIYGYHISGFIPSQLGGFEVTELYRSDIDTTYHITSAQSDAMNKAQEDCYRSFLWDNRERFGEDKDTLSYEDIEQAGLENEFSDYENEWFEPALLRLEIWVDDNRDRLGFGTTGKEPNTVYFRLGLNYNDAPYYRSKADETIWEESLPIETAMRFTPDTFVAFLQDRYSKADK